MINYTGADLAAGRSGDTSAALAGLVVNMVDAKQKPGRVISQIPSVVTVFGTRPEAIKLAPVLRALERRRNRLRPLTVLTSQHTDLLRPFIDLFQMEIDHDLGAMRHGQGLNLLLARIVSGLDPILEQEHPDLVLVQGDTTSALAGAMAAFQRRIPVGHIEAGLRSAHPTNPFPEEMNRRLIGRLATYHFAPTEDNVRTLMDEGLPREQIFMTGNPVVDAVHWIVKERQPSPTIRDVIEELNSDRLIVLTTHRRENFGPVMKGHLEALRRFVENHEDVALIFPVHTNPAVRAAAEAILQGAPRIRLVPPLDYPDFLHLMSHSWLIVSDSGGIQEEVPTLGKALLVLRDTTERQEAIACGAARLVGHASERLTQMLEEAYCPGSWIEGVSQIANPFGTGDSGERIASTIEDVLYGRGGVEMTFA